MLDEIDKLGNDYRGDPSSALLEILDPQQNNSFRDHYLDLPFDLSKVFFIATANQLGPIPPPLRDRMEVIALAGYSDVEKLQIAKRYLMPRQIRENGLKPEQLKITDAAVELIATRYTREAGVRQLERTIGRVARKVALKIAQGEAETVTVDAGDIHDYLGAPRFYPEAGAQRIAGGRGHRHGLDRDGRRSSFHRSDAAARRPRTDDHRTTRRSDAGIGARGAVVSVVARE